MTETTHFSIGLMLKYGDRTAHIPGAEWRPTAPTTHACSAAVLKVECCARGLKVSGSKSTLIGRLTGEPRARARRVANIKKTLALAQRRFRAVDADTPDIDAELGPAKKARSAVMARDGTLKYEAAKDCVDSWAKGQPGFTEEDKAMKQKIWGYEDDRCAFSGVRVKGVGDHMIGMREGFKVGFDHFGANDQWGKIPCASGYNSGNKCWKKVLINGETRWLTYEDFTPEELAIMKETSPDKWQYYNRWLEWRAYAESRGSKLSYANMRNRDETHACIVETHLLRMDAELKETYPLTDEQISAELPARKAKLAALKADYAKDAKIAALKEVSATKDAVIAVLRAQLAAAGIETTD